MGDMTDTPSITVEEVNAAIMLENAELVEKVNELQSAMEVFQEKHNRLASMFLDIVKGNMHNLLVHQAFQDAISEHAGFDVDGWRERGTD